MQEDVAHCYCVYSPGTRGTAGSGRRSGGGRASLARGHLPEAGLAGLVDVVDLLESEPFGLGRGEFGDGGYGGFLGFDGHFDGASLDGGGSGGEV